MLIISLILYSNTITRTELHFSCLTIFFSKNNYILFHCVLYFSYINIIFSKDNSIFFFIVCFIFCWLLFFIDFYFLLIYILFYFLLIFIFCCAPITRIVVMADWENLHSLSERLASVGIMKDQLRALLKPLNTI